MEVGIKDIGAILFLLIGSLTSLYLAGKLAFQCVRLFNGGLVANALLLASLVCAAIGILALDEKSLFGATLLGFMYFVIRGLWVFLHWVTGTPLNESGTSPYKSNGSEDGFYSLPFESDDDDLLTSPRYNTLPGNIFHIDSSPD